MVCREYGDGIFTTRCILKDWRWETRNLKRFSRCDLKSYSTYCTMRSRVGSSTQDTLWRKHEAATSESQMQPANLDNGVIIIVVVSLYTSREVTGFTLTVSILCCASLEYLWWKHTLPNKPSRRLQYMSSTVSAANLLPRLGAAEDDQVTHVTEVRSMLAEDAAMLFPPHHDCFVPWDL